MDGLIDEWWYGGARAVAVENIREVGTKYLGPLWIRRTAGSGEEGTRSRNCEEEKGESGRCLGRGGTVADDVTRLAFSARDGREPERVSISRGDGQSGLAHRRPLELLLELRPSLRKHSRIW